MGLSDRSLARLLAQHLRQRVLKVWSAGLAHVDQHGLRELKVMDLLAQRVNLLVLRFGHALQPVEVLGHLDVLCLCEVEFVQVDLLAVEEVLRRDLHQVDSFEAVRVASAGEAWVEHLLCKREIERRVVERV